VPEQDLQPGRREGGLQGCDRFGEEVVAQGRHDDAHDRRGRSREAAGEAVGHIAQTLDRFADARAGIGLHVRGSAQKQRDRRGRHVGQASDLGHGHPLHLAAAPLRDPRAAVPDGRSHRLTG
jgi:hypothetical protein